METYVDADYIHKANDGRSVSGVAVYYRIIFVKWFTRAYKCVMFVWIVLAMTEWQFNLVGD